MANPKRLGALSTPRSKAARVSLGFVAKLRVKGERSTDLAPASRASAVPWMLRAVAALQWGGGATLLV